ncbi:MAG: leucine-rich repeat domain-containing protein [Bacteroidaceae bacterium]|nr:leucine-rich repeat domain-containing protein [Bacteroidaceae bacterium]
MKHFSRLILAALVTLLSTSAKAYDFELDGIYYNILSLEEKMVQVTVGEKPYAGDIHIPSSIKFVGRKFLVTEVEDGAFCDLDELTSIELPSSIRRVSVFCHNCPKLTNVTFNDGIETLTTSFYYCPSLRTISLPESLKGDLYNDFHFCHALQSIEIPRNIRSITNSFRECTGMTSVIVPTLVATINNSFRGCVNIHSIIPLSPIPVKVDSDSELGITSFDGNLKASCTLYVPLDGLLSYKKDIFWGGFAKIRVLESATSMRNISRD